MHSEVLSINYSCNRHVIKEFHKQIVDFYVVSGNYFLSEGEILCHIPTFVISSQQAYFLWICNLNKILNPIK